MEQRFESTAFGTMLLMLSFERRRRLELANLARQVGGAEKGGSIISLGLFLCLREREDALEAAREIFMLLLSRAVVARGRLSGCRLDDERVGIRGEGSW